MGSFVFILSSVYTVGISLNKMEELEEGKSLSTFSDLDNIWKNMKNQSLFSYIKDHLTQ